ncbi:RDD family protein [bacterium SCSIO 12741]|nr:RDD family protein [bacterium SCSIO 12741]
MRRTIDITTTQNVTIEYGLATVTDRFLAWLVDTVIIWTSMLVLFFFFVAITNEIEELVIFLCSLIYLFYSLLFETFRNGQTPGKYLMRLRVVKINGQPIGFFDYLARWAFRSIDLVMSSGFIAALLVSSTPKGQRLGDYFGNTTVIKTNPAERLRIARIYQLSELENYEPVYPQVTRLKESEVLLIKEVLTRAKKYPGKSSNEAMKELLIRLQETLQIKLPKDKAKFLKTLIKDYVALTR